jgi:uncharacterized protein affecting Mg2+/Co2+ transport
MLCANDTIARRTGGNKPRPAVAYYGYSYSSYCDLSAEIGKMQGAYLMTRIEDRSNFEVIIPEFKLIVPFKLN